MKIFNHIKEFEISNFIKNHTKINKQIIKNIQIEYESIIDLYNNILES